MILLKKLLQKAMGYCICTSYKKDSSIVIHCTAHKIVMIESL